MRGNELFVATEAGKMLTSGTTISLSTRTLLRGVVLMSVCDKSGNVRVAGQIRGACGVTTARLALREAKFDAALYKWRKT